jgi:hypothetical protein
VEHFVVELNSATSGEVSFESVDKSTKATLILPPLLTKALKGSVSNGYFIVSKLAMSPFNFLSRLGSRLNPCVFESKYSGFNWSGLNSSLGEKECLNGAIHRGFRIHAGGKVQVDPDLDKCAPSAFQKLVLLHGEKSPTERRDLT